MFVYTAKQIASYFIEKANLSLNNDLTHLKLQKIIFYAQAEYYLKNNARLYSDPILAWEFGPVVMEVYQWLKGFGAHTINSQSIQLEHKLIDDPTMLFLDEIWEKYSRYSASYLVGKTHASDNPWHHVFYNEKTKVISLPMLRSVNLQADWER